MFVYSQKTKCQLIQIYSIIQEKTPIIFFSFKNSGWKHLSIFSVPSYIECNVPGLFVCWILLVTGSVHFGWQGRTIRLVMEIEENMKALRDLVTVCLVNVIWFGIRRWWHQGYMFAKIARKPWGGVREKSGTRLIFYFFWLKVFMRPSQII